MNCSMEIREKLFRILCHESKKDHIKNKQNEKFANILKKKDVHKIHEENILIREIVNVPLEAEDNTTQLYYSIAHPNFNCRFIFDHSLDHYPFMLLLELGRQVTIGITHVYKNIPVESIKNTINAFNFKNP